MGMTLQNLRDSLRCALGIDANDSGGTDAAMDALLNRSLWSIVDNFPFKEKDAVTSYSTTQSIAFVTCPTDNDAIIDVSVLNPNDGKYYPLTRMSKVEYDRCTDTNTSAQNIPSNYIHMDGALYLNPIPDLVYTIQVRYLKQISDLTGVNTPPSVPRTWHEIILFGAIWRGFINYGDYDRSDRAQSKQSSLIASAVPTEAKEEFDSHYAGVEVIGREL